MAAPRRDRVATQSNSVGEVHRHAIRPRLPERGVRVNRRFRGIQCKRRWSRVDERLVALVGEILTPGEDIELTPAATHRYFGEPETAVEQGVGANGDGHLRHSVVAGCGVR